MHPSKIFDWTDREAMLGLVRRSLAHIFCSAPGGLAVVHAPVAVTDDGKLRFHISRRNRAADKFADNRVLISVVGREAYQSANWYVSADQVPTWHYESVEIDGIARELDHTQLVALLDALSDEFEQLLSPDRPWTRAKMDAQKFDAMTKAIIGFEVDPIDFRGTRKFNQHKSNEDARAMIEGQVGAGRSDIVEAIREVREDSL